MRKSKVVSCCFIVVTLLAGAALFCFRDADTETPAAAIRTAAPAAETGPLEGKPNLSEVQEIRDEDLKADGPVVSLGADLRGSLSELVKVGENSAAITVDFQYAVEGDSYSIVAIEGASAESKEGWQYVAHEASVDMENVSICKGGAQASVPVAYQASIGSGSSTYDTCILIDLSELQGEKQDV